jgi:hypothetical protein
VVLPWLQSRTLVTGAHLPQIDWSAELAENWQSLGKITAQTITRHRLGPGPDAVAWPTSPWCRWWRST